MAKLERIEVAVEDGTRMGAYIARPAARGPHPGLIVLQEVFGVTGHIQKLCQRFADDGYVAMTPEMYHRSNAHFEAGYTEIDKAMEARKKMTPDGIKADLKAAYSFLTHDPGTKADHIGSVGYCMGGNLSFGANTLVPLQAAVSYYGGGIAESWSEGVSALHGPMLFFWGMKDHHIGIEGPRKLADALLKAQKQFASVEFSQADHGFNCDERASYNAEASAEAHALTMAFLKIHLS